MASFINSPYPVFFDTDGTPLENGFIYIGTANQNPVTNPINVYWDEALTQPAAQPIRTLHGYAARNGTPSQIYTASDNFSMLVRNRKEAQVYYTQDATIGSIFNGYPIPSSDVSFLQAGTGAVSRTAQDKMRDAVSVKDFGAVGNGTIDDTAAFVAASNQCNIVYVPDGIYRISTPYALNATAAYFGAGTIKFDLAEWWRAGGSAGGAATERYTLFFKYSNTSDVYCKFNNVSQTITWINDTTFEVPAPAVGVNVKYGVVNGTLILGDTPEQVFAYNTFANGGSDVSPSQPDPLTSPVGFNNAAFGARALNVITTGDNNTAIGSRALTSIKDGLNNTGIGFQSLYRCEATERNTAVGSIAGEWIINGEYNSLFGALSGAKLTTGSYNVAVGESSLGETSAGSYTVAVGHRALGNSGSNYDISYNTAVGTFSGDFARGQFNTWLGYRAGCGASTTNTAQWTVGVGYFALRNIVNADYTVAIGVAALENLTTGTENIAVGANALNSVITGSQNTAVGRDAMRYATANEGTGFGYNALTSLTTGIRNTAVGSRSARLLTTGNNNTVIGRDAMYNALTGDSNTAIGVDALKLKTDGSSFDALSNCSGVGYQSAVSASNQVQLGNSSTTTYAYGAVQNRSDARDKADVRDTVLGLQFVMALRPVDFKWDYREDYISTDEDGNVIKENKDGSKKRTRFHHGLIAQEVKEACESMGVDFGGFQDHSIKGGADVLSIGYDELVAPLIRSIQELTKRVAELESKTL